MRISAWLMRSELTTAPMVVRVFCAAIGPSSFSRAARTAPSCPVVGSSVLPTGATEGDGEGLRARAGRGRRGGAGTGARCADSSWARRWRRGAARAARGRPHAAAGRQGRDRGRRRRRREADRDGLDLDEAGTRGDRRGLEALLGEDRLDLVGRDRGILEADLPLRPAGVVDRELEPGVGERRQQDEDEARDGEDQRDEIEPASLADDIKHARRPRAGRRDGCCRGPRTRPRAARRTMADAPIPGGRGPA